MIGRDYKTPKFGVEEEVMLYWVNSFDYVKINDANSSSFLKPSENRPKGFIRIE